MRSEEVLDSAGGHGENGEGLALVELDILDGWRSGQFGIGGRDDRVEVLEDFLDGDLEGQVGTDDLEGVVLGVGVGLLLLD